MSETVDENMFFNTCERKHNNTHVFSEYLQDLRPGMTRVLENNLDNSWLRREAYIDVEEDERKINNSVMNLSKKLILEFGDVDDYHYPIYDICGNDDISFNTFDTSYNIFTQDLSSVTIDISNNNDINDISTNFVEIDNLHYPIYDISNGITIYNMYDFVKYYDSLFKNINGSEITLHNSDINNNNIDSSLNNILDFTNDGTLDLLNGDRIIDLNIYIDNSENVQLVDGTKHLLNQFQIITSKLLILNNNTVQDPYPPSFHPNSLNDTEEDDNPQTYLENLTDIDISNNNLYNNFYSSSDYDISASFINISEFQDKNWNSFNPLIKTNFYRVVNDLSENHSSLDFNYTWISPIGNFSSSIENFRYIINVLEENGYEFTSNGYSLEKLIVFVNNYVIQHNITLNYPVNSMSTVIKFTEDYLIQDDLEAISGKHNSISFIQIKMNYSGNLKWIVSSESDGDKLQILKKTNNTGNFQFEQNISGIDNGTINYEKNDEFIIIYRKNNLIVNKNDYALF